MRRGELLGLRWQRVSLADPAGPSVRVQETFVRDQWETPKSEASERTIALGPVVAEELFARFGHDGLPARQRPRLLSSGDRRAARPASVRRDAPAGAREGEDRGRGPAVPRRAAQRADERGRGRASRASALQALAGHADLLDDAALHRPGRGGVPREAQGPKTGLSALGYLFGVPSSRPVMRRGGVSRA